MSLEIPPRIRDQKELLETLMNKGDISLEEAKSLMTHGGGNARFVLEHLDNISDLGPENINELVKHVVESGATYSSKLFEGDVWNKVFKTEGFDLKALIDVILENRDEPVDEKSLNTLAHPGTIGELFNYFAEREGRKASADYFTQTLKFAEEGSLHKGIIDIMMKVDYWDTLNDFKSKFDEESQGLIDKIVEEKKQNK